MEIYFINIIWMLIVLIGTAVVNWYAFHGLKAIGAWDWGAKAPNPAPG
jgi:hypothetical protein